jgi:hypothetical protein
MGKHSKKPLSTKHYRTQIPTPRYFVPEANTESLEEIVTKLSAITLRRQQDARIVAKLKERLDADVPLNATVYEQATLRELRSMLHRQITQLSKG